MEEYLVSTVAGRDKLCCDKWAEVAHKELILDTLFNCAFYEITELGGLDFEYRYESHKVHAKENRYETNYIKFKYINSEIIIDKSFGGFNLFNIDWRTIYREYLYKIPELDIRIPMFSNSIVNIDLDYVKPDIPVIWPTGSINTFYDIIRNRILSEEMFKSISDLTHIERDEVLTNYITHIIKYAYANISQPHDKLQDFCNNGWRLMSPDNELDLFDMVELYLINQEMYGTLYDYIYLIKGKDCMVISNMSNNGGKILKPFYFEISCLKYIN